MPAKITQKSCHECGYFNNLNSILENECSAPQLKSQLAVITMDDGDIHQNTTVAADACRDFTFACGPEAKWHTPK